MMLYTTQQYHNISRVNKLIQLQLKLAEPPRIVTYTYTLIAAAAAAAGSGSCYPTTTTIIIIIIIITMIIIGIRMAKSRETRVEAKPE